MANVNKGLGTILQVKIAAVLTTIAQRVEIGGPGMKVAFKPTTHLDSVAVTKRPGLPDGGTLKLKVELDPQDATHKFLFNAIWAPPTPNPSFALKFTDATPGPSTWAFAGIVTGYEPSGMTTEDNLMADVEIEVDGVIVQTP